MRFFNWFRRWGSIWRKPVMESGGSNTAMLELVGLITRLLEEGSRHDTVEEALRGRHGG
jgi:hypothetical protein